MDSKNLLRLVPVFLIAAGCLLLAPASALAQFGGGTQIVFDPSMFARQLQQLQQETAEVTTLAQQLQYTIKNTTSGSAGLWQSNQGLLMNLGDLINEQEGLSYTIQDVGQQFRQLYPGYDSTSISGVESPQASTDTALNTLNGALASAQAQAQNFHAKSFQHAANVPVLPFIESNLQPRIALPLTEKGSILHAKQVSLFRTNPVLE